MRRFVSRRRGFPRRRIPTKWTGQQLNGEATRAAGGQDDIVILAPSDYEGGTVGGNVEAGGATLLRVIGDVSVRATVLGAVAYAAIYCIGQNEGPLQLNTGIEIISGDVLWQDVWMVPVDTNRQFHVDIRSKRRLENDRVIFSIRAVAQTVTYAGQWRALMKSTG